MAHTISNFKDGFNGGTRANRFNVTINWPTAISGAASLNLNYHVIAAKLPSAELGTIKVPYRGRIAYYAGDRDYKPWTITILDDTGVANNSWKYFHKWADLLGSHDNNTASDPTFAQAADKSKLLTTLVFTQRHDPTAAGLGFLEHKKITLYHAWPSEIGEISLDMGEGGGLVSYSVTFVYDYYVIDNDGAPSTTPPTSSLNSKNTQYPNFKEDAFTRKK